jgi:hypothetical protein
VLLLHVAKLLLEVLLTGPCLGHTPPELPLEVLELVAKGLLDLVRVSLRLGAVAPRLGSPIGRL